MWTRAATVREQAHSRGQSASTGRLWEGGAQRAAAAMRERGFQSLNSGARAQAPQVRIRCGCNLGSCACEYGFANERRARVQFVISCRARESRNGNIRVSRPER
eukprot:6208793-Pleurochrysis_carterae.AAC.1